jgi:serine/threonine protein kinase
MTDKVEKVAVKIYNKTKMRKKQKKSNLTNEVMALRALSHPNIVKLLYVFQDEVNIYLVMEYIEGESLLSFLK